MVQCFRYNIWPEFKIRDYLLKYYTLGMFRYGPCAEELPDFVNGGSSYTTQISFDQFDTQTGESSRFNKNSYFERNSISRIALLSIQEVVDKNDFVGLID